MPDLFAFTQSAREAAARIYYPCVERVLRPLNGNCCYVELSDGSEVMLTSEQVSAVAAMAVRS